MALVNVIHPYTYKLKGDSLVLGPISEYEERDKQIYTFLSQAQEMGTTIVHQRDMPARSFRGMVIDLAFLADPFYNILLDAASTVTITPLGLPLPDRRKKGLPIEQWKEVKQIYTSHSQLERVMRTVPARKTADYTFFIGDVLENCVANAVQYFHQFYRGQQEQVYYVPELCVSLDEKLRSAVELRLRENKIKTCTVEQALQLLGKGRRKRA